jgi:hypothetical protein
MEINPKIAFSFYHLQSDSIPRKCFQLETAHIKCDKIGRIFAHWVTVYLGSFLKITNQFL